MYDGDLYYLGTSDGNTWWSQMKPFESGLNLWCYAGTLNAEAVRSGRFDPKWEINPKHVVWSSKSDV